MNILIVFAHPEPASFNGALKDKAVSTFKEMGHNVIVSDLYRMGWKPQLDMDDFPAERLDAKFLNISAEQEHMCANGLLGADVLAEQEKIEWADLVVFQFPIWWFSMPAILKGWVERTMVRGFAYAAGRKYDTGMFKGKKAMICATTGTASSLYEPDGIDGDINQILWPIHNGIFRYLGFDVLKPFMSWMPGNVSLEQRTEYLKSYEQRLRNIEHEESLYFHPREDYGDDQRLKPGVAAKTGFQWNPKADQNRVEAAITYTNNTREEQLNAS